MAVVYRRCAGLDVHRDTIAACVRVRLARGKHEEQRRTFGTFTSDLKRLAEWLRQQRVRQVAMESTGVYWIPVWNVLEASRYRFQQTLANPTQVRALRGHKTDQIDCARIAEFLAHDRLAGSFIPPRPVREARDLVRLRVHTQQDRNRVVNRIGRLLQTVNVKLSSVLSDIVGLSGRRILRALASGKHGPELAELVHPRLESKKPLLREALEGRYSEHFRYLLHGLIEDLDRLDGKIEELDRRLEAHMAPHVELIGRLRAVPGIDKLTAWTILAEIGAEVSAFPDAKHLASWAGLCPGNDESAGKRKKGRTRKGNRYLRRALVQAGWAAAHSKRTFLAALFLRLARNVGMKKAIVAVAHRLLVTAFYMIRDGSSYRERGDDYFDRLHPERTARRLISRLERLGHEISPVRLTAEDSARPVADSRGRGRPCKCAERGLPCHHQYAQLPIRPRVEQPVRRPPPAPPSPGEMSTAPGCRICANWGVPCFHVRPRKPKIKTTPPEGNLERSQ